MRPDTRLGDDGMWCRKTALLKCDQSGEMLEKPQLKTSVANWLLGRQPSKSRWPKKDNSVMRRLNSAIHQQFERVVGYEEFWNVLPTEIKLSSNNGNNFKPLTVSHRYQQKSSRGLIRPLFFENPTSVERDKVTGEKSRMWRISWV